MDKILTIAIPTYNRASYLDLCLENICKQSIKYSNIIEIIVSDNCSNDNTSEIVNKYINFGNDIKYIKNDKNIGPDGNFLQCLNFSTGKYLHIIGDDDILLPGSLGIILKYISNDDYGVIYLNSYSFDKDYSYTKKKKKIKISTNIYKNKNNFIDEINIMFTFISGNIVNKKFIQKNIEHDKLLNTGIIQFYWYVSAALNCDKNLYINDYCVAAKAENTGGYSVCKVFGVNLVDALNYFEKFGLSKKTNNKFRKILLTDFLPIFILKQKKNTGKFSSDDFYSLLYPVHKNTAYFWLVTVPIIKLPVVFGTFWRKKVTKMVKLVDKIFNPQKNQHKKENCIFLKFKNKFDKRLKKIHNFFLNRSIRNFQGYSCKGLSIHPSAKITGLAHIKFGDNFVAGEHLRIEAVSEYYGSVYSPEIVIKDNVILNDFVHIGAVNYVEIGNNVLMASKIYISDHNHGNYNGLFQSSPTTKPSTRPLNSNSKVIIGDNVWIGEFVTILPGVTIGEGSIIGSNSVVSKDIPANSIAVGAPARIVKKYDFEVNEWIKV